MSFFLTLLGVVLLVTSVAAISFGVFMATSSKTRDLGKYFALWWIPGAALSVGVLMRDVVTVIVGLACFAVAGCVFGLEARRIRKNNVLRGRERRTRRDAENTTAENQKNQKRGYSRRRAS